MASISEARTAIMAVVQQIQTDFTAFPLVVEIDNRTAVDQGTQQNPYLVVEIEPMGGDQVELGQNPLMEQRGQILIYACAREGTGAMSADQLLDFVVPYFDRQVLGFVQCMAVVATKPKKKDEWRYSPAVVNYYYHRKAT